MSDPFWPAPLCAEPLRMAPCDEPVLLRCGALLLSRDICDRYFLGMDQVVLVRLKERVNILPARRVTSGRACWGGYFLKRRNPRGDRVIDAPDFFRAQGFAEAPAVLFEARWNAELFGLTLGPALASAFPEPLAVRASSPRN